MFRQLERMYNKRGRYYHNLKHVNDCLCWLMSLSSYAEDPSAIWLAIWFHDCIYDTKRSDNEERSADLAWLMLAKARYPDAERISRLVRSTKIGSKLESNDEKLLHDIDYSIMGAYSAHYEQYSIGVRKEYGWVPGRKYYPNRLKFLESLPQDIFLHPAFEFKNRKARQNVDNEIYVLRQGRHF